MTTAFLTDDPLTASTAVRAVDMFSIWPMFAASVVCLTAGALLGLSSRYGLVRYWWVAVKLGITVLMSTLIVIALRPGIDEAVTITDRLMAGDPAAALPSDLIYPVVVAPTLLITAYLLSVFKPWKAIGGARRG